MPTPQDYIQIIKQRYPGIYHSMDICADAKHDLGWPDYCPIPIGAAYESLRLQGADMVSAGHHCAGVTAAWAWDKHRIMYSFAPELAAALVAQAEDMRDTDVLPVDLLLHLPYPCIYIRTDQVVSGFDGFFAWIEYDVNRHEPELRVQMLHNDCTDSIPFVLHLLHGKTIGDCYSATVAEALKYADVEDAISYDVTLRALQLILYLISQDADVDKPTTKPGGRPPRSKRKASDRHHSTAPRTYRVGLRVAAALRRSVQHAAVTSSTCAGSPKRPHTRRGHWHHYWIGPRSGDRTLILKWIAPTVINPDGTDDGITIIPVKE